MRHLRYNLLPKIPNTCQDIHDRFQNEKIMKEYGVTYHDRPRTFYKGVYECATFSYCVFASDETIETMQANITVENRHFLIDGTFKVVPLGPFTQLLVIYIQYFHEVGACCQNNSYYFSYVRYAIDGYRFFNYLYMHCLHIVNLFLGFSDRICIYVQENSASI